MPLYDYKCTVCNAGQTVLKKIVDLNRTENCPKCQFVMTRRISAPRIVTDYAGYSCPVSGKWVEGRAAHRENLATQGCRVFEPGEKEAFLRNKAKSEEAFDEQIGESAAQIFEAMPADKKEAMEVALSQGFDISVERRSV